MKEAMIEEAMIEGRETMTRSNLFESNRKSCLLSLVSVALIAGSMSFSHSSLADGATNDVLACYAWDTFPKERINLNVRGGGPLTSATETPKQRTHGIHGKHVGSCGEGTNAALTGVLVFEEGTGSHLGVYSAQSRGGEDSNDDEHCRPVSIECFSAEASKTPAQWTCQSRNEFGVYHGESTLTRVAIDTSPDDPLCGVFENEDSFEESNEGADGIASGMRPDAD